jgi:hypothetical protein
VVEMMLKATEGLVLKGDGASLRMIIFLPSSDFEYFCAQISCILAPG